ncbi:endolytic transglycosylase MltG [Candidatus Poribacteria bacterium]|nr:endolytic transglycosylase MltG [Candidatus Poribacteria bacterium]
MFIQKLQGIFSWKRCRRYVLYGFGCIVIVCISGILIGGYYLSPPSNSEEIVSVTIVPGSNTTTIANRLASENLIRSSFAFKLVVRYQGVGTQLRAGKYQLSRDMPLSRILDELKKGQIEYQTFTIPESLTATAIAELWEKAGLGTADEFQNAIEKPVLLEKYVPEGVSAEGYLFPNTYKFAKGTTAETVVKMMLAESYDLWSESLAEEAKILGFTRHQVITLASIIGREAGSKSEIPIISSVFHNRLKHNWRLQADPTVLYAFGDPKRLLTREDLKTDSPYNTYRHKGLPPGPIGNPGKAAILGALRPDKTSFYYFVATEPGKHHFSKTLDEHNRMRRQIRRNRKSSNNQ